MAMYKLVLSSVVLIGPQYDIASLSIYSRFNYYTSAYDVCQEKQADTMLYNYMTTEQWIKSNIEKYQIILP